MTDSNDAFTLFLAAALAFALLLGLSEDAWRLLRLFWIGLATLSLMAVLEPLRRGLAKRGGGMPLPLFAALVCRALILGLLFSSLCVAFLFA